MNTRINLQPIAAPSILGHYAFAGSTLMVAANMAGWYGNSVTALYLIPFTTVFGGIAQFVAGMWAYKARDAIATALPAASRASSPSSGSRWARRSGRVGA
jgi:uncharacterized protein